jgi:hypothetical protein
MELYAQKRDVLLEDITKLCKSEFFPNSASIRGAGTDCVFDHRATRYSARVNSYGQPIPHVLGYTDDADELLVLLDGDWKKAARSRLIDVVANMQRRNWHELLGAGIEALITDITDQDLEEHMREGQSIAHKRAELMNRIADLTRATSVLEEIQDM